VEGYLYGADIYKRLGEKRFFILQAIYSRAGVIAFLLFLAILIAKITMENSANLGVVIGSVILSGVVYNFKQNYYLTIATSLAASIIIGMIVL
jgi:hypothetical protein